LKKKQVINSGNEGIRNNFLVKASINYKNHPPLAVMKILKMVWSDNHPLQGEFHGNESAIKWPGKADHSRLLG
jgi:hypothetical protein